ncbi:MULTISPECIES: long-chain-fatty-acid--CoA ligase [Kitasatospora]|uniref:Putative long-chain fatty-acid--CoA ligase n=1 Tax=Kitasatospora setae (strain ATCC 33774 / DSM 43861 / JCM 3304 / KCC A-0304 / NBRC 14216 / KM-6054) TaxID=452652 RepID=E4NBF3_KITSK|nr:MULTISPECIES: long-chain-fatty-acid--CoA ligase [Kitasatospora]BAJ28534.1 putative long-chain fatty-acid--CoA ligase [Kitasatospora setae KM-6054]
MGTAQTLAEAAARHAAERPGHPAVLCEGRVTDYRRIDEESSRAARAILAAGLGTGSRVAYLGKESEHYYELALACAKAGTVLVPVNWRLTAGEAEHILSDSAAELLFAEPAFGELVEKVRPLLPGLRQVVELAPPGESGGQRAWAAGFAATPPGTAGGPDDAVLQIYTSGTTGAPKGVVLAHRSFFTLPAAMAGAGVAWIDWLPTDRNLISLPGFSIAGMGWFMHGFAAGGTNVVMRMFVSEEAVRLIAEHGVTTTFAAPAMLQMMIEERGASKAAFRSLRKVAYGAAPMSDALLGRCLELLDCEFAQIYAATETGTVAVCLPPEDHWVGSPVLGSVGRACPGHRLKVVDDAGEELPPGAIGRVCVSTPARMLGYWGLPGATADAIDGEWLRMGDAGYLTEDGYLYLCDRINDTIIAAGQNIYPAEVEKALDGHPAVAESAVLGVPDELWGDAVLACVVVRPGRAVTPRELLRHLSGRLADYKTPTRWEFVDAVPRNPTGKILRRVLRERYLAAAAAPAAPTAAALLSEGDLR